MSTEIIGLIGIIVVVILIFARMWIGLAIPLVGFVGIVIILGPEQAFSALATIPFVKVAFYPMSAIPLFILMGTLIANTGIGADLYNTANKLVGQFRGGLAIATLMSGAVFAAVTGVAMAAIAVFGKVALPQMKKFGYDDRLTSGSIASASTLAFLIPPSLAFIVYGIITETSIARLFMAGILPGVLVTVAYVITTRIITARRPGAGPAGPKTSLKEKASSLKHVWHVVILFLLVIGGIYGGIFTPTEAGAIGSFGAIIITVASRRLTSKILFDSLKETMRATGMIFLLIFGAYIFIRFLSLSRLPFMLSEFLVGLPWPPMAVIAVLVIFYIIIGMFLEIFSAVILTVPIILPALLAMGIDPIWFGVIIVLVINMGLVTPPVGIAAYMLAGMTGVPSFTVFRGVVPFLIAAIICIIILAIFPQIALFLPGTM
jgi:C4-dicarboxylate transporter DctM subunit